MYTMMSDCKMLQAVHLHVDSYLIDHCTQSFKFFFLLIQSNLDYPDPFGHGCPDTCLDNWNRPDNENQYSTIWAHAQINDIHTL